MRRALWRRCSGSWALREEGNRPQRTEEDAFSHGKGEREMQEGSVESTQDILSEELKARRGAPCSPGQGVRVCMHMHAHMSPGTFMRGFPGQTSPVRGRANGARANTGGIWRQLGGFCRRLPQGAGLKVRRGACWIFHQNYSVKFQLK